MASDRFASGEQWAERIGIGARRGTRPFDLFVEQRPAGWPTALVLGGELVSHSERDKL